MTNEEELEITLAEPEEKQKSKKPKQKSNHAGLDYAEEGICTQIVKLAREAVGRPNTENIKRDYRHLLAEAVQIYNPLKIEHTFPIIDTLLKLF